MKVIKTYNFNHCGATGRLGPSQGQVDSSYKGTSLEGMVFNMYLFHQESIMQKSRVPVVEHNPISIMEVEGPFWAEIL